MKSSVKQLWILAATGLLTGFFIYAAAMHLRRDAGWIAWVSIAIATFFCMYFAKALNQLYLKHVGSPFAAMPGDVVSVLADENEFGVAKLLAVDDAGVHARMYAQRFTTRPTHVDFDSLTMSIGHMPLSWATFAAWKPNVIAEGVGVSQDELEGFRIWQENGGGYF